MIVAQYSYFCLVFRHPLRDSCQLVFTLIDCLIGFGLPQVSVTVQKGIGIQKALDLLFERLVIALLNQFWGYIFVGLSILS